MSICEPRRNTENTAAEQVLTNTVGNKRSSTFLQSAKAIIVNEFTKQEKIVRVLLDNGSQRSFITEEAAKKLNLRSVRQERLILSGFGETGKKLDSLDIVRVIVQNMEGKKCGVVELCVVPFICKPISDQALELAQATYEHLINLKLADSTDGEATLKLDVLIGGEEYWVFCSKE